MRLVVTHNVDRLQAAFKDPATPKSVFSQAINKTTRKMKTKTKRRIATHSGFKSGYVQGKLRTHFASPKSLESRITASDRWSTILRFKPTIRKGKKGRKWVTAAPWKKRQKFKKRVFVLNFSGNMVPVYRSGKKLKTVYGPSVGRDMDHIYDISGNYAAQQVADVHKEIEELLTPEIARLYHLRVTSKL